MKRSLVCALFVCCVSMWAAGPKGVTTAAEISIEAVRPDNLSFQQSEDGVKYIALKLHKQDAAAVRVHIGGMHLSSEEKLFIYNADGSQVYGPFSGAGPVESGEFWSEAISGSDVIVEFQAGPKGAADLPFNVDGVEAAEPAALPVAVEQSARETRESLFRGMPITHDVINGMAIFQGDILLGRASELTAALPTSKTPGRSAVAITGSQYRWPNGTVPYVIAGSLPSPERIKVAVDHWNTVMAGTVRMVPRTTESNYVAFVNSADAGVCSSYVGMTGYGSQSIYVGGYCSSGNIIHEIGHAFGLWHEHTREDRNRYVVVNYANISAGQAFNFDQNIASGDDVGTYDFNSVMHYGATSFSANGLPTIVTIPAGIPIGQRSGLSTGDVEAILLLYPNTVVPAPEPTPAPVPAPVTAPVTITSNPVGLSVTIDGVNYTTPATLAWLPGSTHTVSANDAILNGVRGTFAGWSDGGAQSHTVVSPSASLLLKADYAMAYSVKAAANASGTVSVSPTSADGFYPSGMGLTLVATPASGYCFANWSGLIAGTPARTSLFATKAYDLIANFQPGSVSLSTSAMNVAVTGGALTIGVTATYGCTSGVFSSAAWATPTSNIGPSGSGTVTVSVAPNTTGALRAGLVSIGNKSVIVIQAAR